MNRRIKIFHFKTDNQDRIAFVSLLAEYNSSIGLKAAKGLQDQMLRGKPIEYSIESENFQIFSKALDRLDLKYEIIN